MLDGRPINGGYQTSERGDARRPDDEIEKAHEVVLSPEIRPLHKDTQMMAKRGHARKKDDPGGERKE